MGFKDKFKNIFGSGKKENESIVSQKDDFEGELSKQIRTSNDEIRNFKYLDDLIHSGAKEIVLDSDIVLGADEEFKEGILIDEDDMVIDGNKFTIDACGKTRMFIISANNVTLKNLSFKNGFSFRGGSIDVCENASLTITDCYFEGNCADSAGGAIHNYSPLNIINCKFNGNSALRGGGVIYNQGSSTVNFVDCIFCENSSKSGPYGHAGGVILSEHKSFSEILSTLNFNNCEFIQNSAEGSGGVICLWESKLNLTDCTFNNNSSGVIYCRDSSFNLIDCHFNENNGHVINNSSNLSNSLNNCTFIENEGGVVYCQQNSLLKVTDCTFFKNSSKQDGAVIFNREGDLKFTDCTFKKNKSLKSAGCIYNEATISLYDCNFEDNCAGEDGSDIYNRNLANIYDSNFINSENNRNIIFQSDNEDNTLSIMGSTFTTSNTICIENGFISFENSKFNIDEKNYAIYSKKAVLSIFMSKFNPNAVIFCDNIIELDEENEFENQIEFGENFKSIRYRSSVYPVDYKGFKYLDDLISGNSSEITIECDIKLHEAEKNFYEGGIELNKDLIINGNGHIIDANHLSRMFIITSGNVVLKNIIFKNGKHFKNHLRNDLGGGAILALPFSTLTIEDCQFVENDSRQNAGAIYNKSPELTISNSEFANNSSQYNGGVIFTDGSLILNKCDFNSNSSKWGGAICNNHILECDETHFKENCSEIGAGAIYNQKGNINLKNSSFEANYSNRGEGGAIYNDKGAFLDLFDCKFMENYSKLVDGGAVYNVGDLNCMECHFDLNKAYHQGGAIDNGGSFNLINCNFKENSSLFGGAIHNKWDLFKCMDCSFKEDFAKYNGNEVFINQNGSLELSSCKFENLDIYQDDETGPLTIINCSFKAGNIKSMGNIKILKNEKGKYEEIIDGYDPIQYIN